MGVVKKFGFCARTLDDSVVKDGLESVSVLNGKEPYFLVGGIATQSYLPSSCRRPTSDIDFALVRPLSKPDFRKMVAPISEYLHDLGYETFAKTNNRSRSFALYASRSGDDCKDSFCLEFVRRNGGNFEKHKERLQRELDHAKEKIVEGRESTYSVSSPEDIAVPKLVRSINTIRRNAQSIHYIPPRLQILPGDLSRTFPQLICFPTLKRIQALSQELLCSPYAVESTYKVNKGKNSMVCSSLSVNL